MDGITLRVFSGIHLGAEIDLADGAYVLGTDDSCDLIFGDSSLAARHAVLRVSSTEKEAQVTIEPLDGSVTFAGNPLQQEQAVPPRRPFRLGLVIFAWTESSSAENAAWQEVEEHIVRAGKSNDETLAGESTSDTATMSAVHDSDANKSATNSGQEPLTMEESAEDGKKSDIPRSSGRILKKAGLGLTLVLIGLLSLTWKGSRDELSPEQQVRSLLDEAGYQKLTVTGTENGVTVTGRIASDRERGRLLRLAQFLQFPVYLDVTVRSDAADAVKASFNTLGLYPDVTELPPSAHPGLLVKGYIKNGILEEQALSEAVRNVPDLQVSQATGKPKLALFRDIRYETDVQVLLVPALAAAGLNTVKTEYLPGRILLHGAFTPQTRASLEKAAAGVEERLGVPVRFDIVNDSETLQPIKNDNIYAREEKKSPARQFSAPAERDSTTSFRVTSVSMGALRFITLADGERIFEGGDLPGGYRLEHISVDALTLSKNNSTITYPLRGSHE